MNVLMIIKYKVQEKNIRLFGNLFVENNKENCKIKIDEKEKELTEFYNNEDLSKKIIEIQLSANNII